jgi:hypothetical protein
MGEMNDGALFNIQLYLIPQVSGDAQVDAKQQQRKGWQARSGKCGYAYHWQALMATGKALAGGSKRPVAG